MTDLLNDFWRETEKQKHLSCYTSMIKRARPYSLDDDATDLITELASGDTINDKIAVYRMLARLPFDTVWLEFSYLARYNKRKELGVLGDQEMPDDAPDRMAFLLERMTETSWRATTVVRYPAIVPTESSNDDPLRLRSRNVDTFAAVHVLSTEGPVNYYSHNRDADIREIMQELNKDPIHAGVMWGFRAKSDEGKIIHGLPSHLNKANAIDLARSWEPIIEAVAQTTSEKKKKVYEFIQNSCQELQGDLRFLLAALATINEVPTVINEVRQPGTMRVGGAMRPYMINRVVTIGIPKKRGRLRKVMGLLRLADKRMRAHEVSGHWKIVRSGANRAIVEKRWINDYQRGDASLGYVRQEREVVKK